MSDGSDPSIGRNGVAITTARKYESMESGYRTYEVYQRERVGESTEKIKPAQLNSPAHAQNPYPFLEVLREHYPFYRDWTNNCYWVTRYDDVTSIFVDDANFETRPRAWYLSDIEVGSDFRDNILVGRTVEKIFDEHCVPLASALLDEIESDEVDLVSAFFAPLTSNLIAQAFGVAKSDWSSFGSLLWQLQRGVGWHPLSITRAHLASKELALLLEPAFDVEGRVPAAIRSQDPQAEVKDVLATLLELDFQTLFGSLSNLWCLLMLHPEERQKVVDPRTMKLAYLETLRHSAPITTAQRFARHEVERFGKLIPNGALLKCSAAAANRDPRIFANPDDFIVDRADLCQREARGQYRADGLASGVAVGLGKPSRHPAVPEDRARSTYALTRDTVVSISMQLLARYPKLSLAGPDKPFMRSLNVDELYTCWSLPTRI
ncbi:MAG: cytochrome P450 [Pseudomonadota bacterium]